MLNLTIVSFSWVCPFIDNKFRHNIVKEVCGSTHSRSWSLTEQTHEKVTSNQTISWIVIYPVDIVFHLSNNPGLRSIDYSKLKVKFNWSGSPHRRYGDRTPFSNLARLIAVFWTLTGVIIIGILVGVIAVSLTSASVGVDYKLYGAKVSWRSSSLLQPNGLSIVKGALSRHFQIFWPRKNYVKEAWKLTLVEIRTTKEITMHHKGIRTVKDIED